MDVLVQWVTKLVDIPHKLLSSIVFLLGAGTFLYLLAQISWQLVPTDHSEPSWSPAQITSQNTQTVDVTALKQLSLFGQLDEVAQKPKAAAVTQMITDAPKTSLSILLTGIVASSAKDNGLAIIESGSSQDTYSLGDKIKSTSARLKQVYADRVIISNNGRYETLMLDGIEFSRQQSEPVAVTATGNVKKRSDSRPDSRNNRATRAKFSRQSRDKLLADPGSITEYLSISPVKQAGEMQGYRLNPGKDPALFKDAGLKNNDLATSINGYDLTNTGQALEIMSQLSELTEVSLMVERQGQLMEIIFSLPQ